MEEKQEMSKLNVEAKLNFRKYIWINYRGHSFTYSLCEINYTLKANAQNTEMTINIASDIDSETVWSIFVEILDFMYLALGSMPKIIYYKENGMNKDLSKILNRFSPSTQFDNDWHLIDISPDTLNERTLANIKNIINNKPFEIFKAFTALTSEAYEHIYSEHKITLLLHCLEGYIYNDVNFQGETFVSRISQIVNVLFEYETKYNTEILNTLLIPQKEYSTILKDTRHQFSHYINKSSALSKGQNYIIHFTLLHYIFRIFLLKEIKVVPNGKNVEEFLNSIYDWVNTLINPDFKNFKSIAYKTHATKVALKMFLQQDDE